MTCLTIYCPVSLVKLEWFVLGLAVLYKTQILWYIKKGWLTIFAAWDRLTVKVPWQYEVVQTIPVDPVLTAGLQRHLLLHIWTHLFNF
jgi:hypothetical protein